MLTEKMINWKNEQLEKAYEENGPKSYARAFVAGMVEGFVDTAVVTYTVASVIGIGIGVAGLIKKK